MTHESPDLTGFLVRGFLIADNRLVAVVYATGREHCKRVLRERLPGGFVVSDDQWIIDPITPVPASPSARIVNA